MNDSNRDSFDDWWADPTKMPYAILPHSEEKDTEVQHQNVTTPIQQTRDMSLTPPVIGRIVERTENERSQFRTPDTCNPSGSPYESLQKNQRQLPTFTPRSPARRFNSRYTPRSTPVSSRSTTSTSSRTDSQKTRPLRIRF